jgi:solute carrier family 25 citrate transporter 1
LQKQVVHPGKTPKYTGLLQACILIAKEEGILALWKGITPRLLRIMPGQAITFMTYEFVSGQMNRFGFFDVE